MNDCGLNVRRMALKLIKGHGRDAMVVAAQWVRCAEQISGNKLSPSEVRKADAVIDDAYRNLLY